LRASTTLPVSDHVVDPREGSVEPGEGAAQEFALDRCLGALEKRVYGEVICMLLAIAAWDDIPLLACGHDRDHQVAIDMRIHPRKRVLDGRNVGARAGSQERIPGSWCLARVCGEGIQHAKVQIGEKDIEALYESGILETRRLQRAGHRLGDSEIQMIEANDAVAGPS
jgi:hypothetical protein